MSPYVLEETGAYAVVYKPPGMFSVPLRRAPRGDTLLDWYARLFPAVLSVRGRNPPEGGILHRLDYGTQGLVLFAKTQAAMDALAAQQEAGGFVKEYGALSAGKSAGLPGFPVYVPPGKTGVIESAFRPYGPGRKAVRPVLPGGKGRPFALDRGALYRTEVAERTAAAGRLYFRLRITRGFRHQIRCHLAWIGCPVINDLLYGGGEDSRDGLALRAQGIFFSDPLSGVPRRYTIEPLGPG
jgi:23S rRNA pseudouridine1911/1915/1917 synthase